MSYSVNRIFLILAFLLISFVVYGFYISQFEFSLINQKNKPNNYSTRVFYDYKISLNIYTNLSTGSGNPASIALEAKKARLNYIMLSDINMDVDLEPDRYISSVGVLSANKINSENSSYILYSPTNKDVLFPSTIQIYKKNVDSILIAAHPIIKKYNYEYS